MNDDQFVEGWVKIEEVRQHFDTAGCGTIYKTGGEGRVPLYSAPQREWVGLTDAEYESMAEQYVTNCYFDTLKYAKAIEAKLKEKNSTSDKNIQTSDNKPPKSTQGEG